MVAPSFWLAPPPYHTEAEGAAALAQSSQAVKSNNLRDIASTLLKHFFQSGEVGLWLDLLDEELNRRLLLHPKEIEFTTKDLQKGSWIVIDEVQKAPGLLNYVQRLIESRGFKFALTGSSARKLKRDSANLLGGRAHSYSLMTLSRGELGDDFELKKTLEVGLLPTVWTDPIIESQKDYLRGYLNNYIRQEITRMLQT